jgi:hypothetical protein
MAQAEATQIRVLFPIGVGLARRELPPASAAAPAPERVQGTDAPSAKPEG